MSGGPTLLAVLSVVGYLLLRHCCHRTHFRWDALEWQQNLFESTALGLGLFAICRLASSPAIGLSTVFHVPAESALAFLHASLPVPFGGSVLGALALGLPVAWLANHRWPKDRALMLAVIGHGGSLRVLLHDAHLENRPVMLTLASRKVYVGWVFTPPPLHRTAHVVIFPTLSGHRTTEALTVEWTTDYSSVYLDLTSRIQNGERLTSDPEHFQLVIPLDLITSATYFDKELYDRHFAGAPM